MLRSLPPPTLTFTLPSHGDGTLLSCRIYHPRSLTAPLDPAVKHPWSAQKKAAILAHPYAPLGGSQDDHVLDVVGGLLLEEEGFIVGTFDFRGAGSSQGKTSWTAKREAEDYVSFAGFMLYYMHFLEVARLPREQGRREPSARGAEEKQMTMPRLLMGGYSFGAVVLTMIPPLDGIAPIFERPLADSHIAQIRLRAEALAHQQSDLITAFCHQQGEQCGHARNRSNTSTRVGGDENTGSPRQGRHRRSLSKAARTFHETEEKMRNRVNSLLHRSRQDVDAEHEKDDKLPPVAGLHPPHLSYLLISRPQGLLAHLATLSLLPSSISRPRRSREEEHAEGKLVQNPTLLVYGDQDGFVALAKQREYVSRLERLVPESRFLGREITGAGHFWAEEGALSQLHATVAKFVEDSGKMAA